MDIQSQEAIYHSLRKQHHFLSAVDAWRQAGEIVETNRWAASVEFDWKDQYEPRQARWHEAGYELTASFPADEGGWAMGGDMIGQFSNKWQLGAVTHKRGNYLNWFMPAAPSMAHCLYKRACDYESGWAHLQLGGPVDTGEWSKEAQSGFLCSVNDIWRQAVSSASSNSAHRETSVEDTSKPHNCSVTRATLRVDTPSTYIWAYANFKAHLLRRPLSSVLG